MIVQLNKIPAFHALAGSFLLNLSCIATVETLRESTFIVLKLQETDNPDECPIHFHVYESKEEIKFLMEKAGILVK